MPVLEAAKESADRLSAWVRLSEACCPGRPTHASDDDLCEGEPCVPEDSGALEVIRGRFLRFQVLNFIPVPGDFYMR